MPEIAVYRYPPRYGRAPRLGPVQVQEVELDGRKAYTMRRTDALDAPGIVLSEEALALSAFFDGQHDLRAVQHDVHRQYGQLLYCEKIHELALALWRAGLFGPVKASATRSLRPPVFAGSAYEADPDQLRAMLDATFADGPGEGRSPGANVCGIVSPHLDLFRAGAVYAHAYKALVDHLDADLFVVFGTAHQNPPRLFSLTRRDYDTPLGPVKTDPDALAMLAAEFGDAFVDESAHDEEHSIELQALYLRHLLAGRPFTVLPVLCSSLYDGAARGERPEDQPEFTRFIEALGRAVQGRKVAWIAAADLSHVGLVYGDDSPPTAEALASLALEDRESLATLDRGDAGGFFDHVTRDALTRRICGLAPIYAAMKASGATGATLLKYDQWFGADEGSAVTFAAATLEAP